VLGGEDGGLCPIQKAPESLKRKKSVRKKLGTEKACKLDVQRNDPRKTRGTRMRAGGKGGAWEKREKKTWRMENPIITSLMVGGRDRVAKKSDVGEATALISKHQGEKE